jgi:hypothetical protein
MYMGHSRNDADMGKQMYGDATLCTIKPTVTALALNLDLCSDRAVTNCPSHGTAWYWCKEMSLNNVWHLM